MTLRFRSLMLAGLVPLAGCAAGPDYRPAPPAALGVPEGYSVPAQATPQPDLTRWWASFDDPMLGELVQQAATENLDVGQAVTRLRQARAQLAQSRAALLPSLTGGVNYTRNQTLRGGAGVNTLPDGTIISTGGGGSSDSYSLGPDVSYQVDLFGRNARTIESARANYEASGFDYASVLIATQGEIARNYVLARLAQQQLANARRSLDIQSENLEIAGFRVQAGLVSSLDQEQARAQRAQTAATVPQIEQSYNQAVSRLGVLTGRAPGALKAQLEQARPIPRGPAAVAVGIPTDTLRQRPDVRSAERQLAAATAQIGVAEAQLYPALSIGGSIDTNANAISDLFDIITGRIFLGLSQTIFDNGRLRGQLRSARAAADGAFLAYKSSVLTALEDVENAIVALRTAQAREAEFRIAYDAADAQALLARTQYRSGLTDFTTLNQSESQLFAAANSLAQAQADQANALVQLYGALGGGWDSATVPQVDQLAESTALQANRNK